MTFAIALCDIALSRAAADVKPESFRDVVEERFAHWDQNQDGKLSAHEVDHQVTDHKNQGPVAAAAAAVHIYLRRKGAPPSVARAVLLQDHETAAARRDKDDQHPHFAADYAAFSKHIHNAPRQVFAQPQAPVLEGMSQGRLGDCYFVSAVGAAVHRNPKAVRAMFQVHADGSTEIAFPGGHKVRVPQLTDAEIALGSSAGDQGLWLNLLEKGYGELKITSPKAHRSPADLELDVIARGGDADQTISLLTGHKALFSPIRQRKGGELLPPGPGRIPALHQELHHLLSVASANHAVVCVGTCEGHAPPGIATGHDYAVVGYDHTKQVVHVWNPWGHTYNFTPQSEPAGLEHGYEIKSGLFLVPLDHFVRIFSGVFHETGEPLARK